MPITTMMDQGKNETPACLYVMQNDMQEGSDSRHDDDMELSPTPHLRLNPSPTEGAVADSTTTEKRQQVG